MTTRNKNLAILALAASATAMAFVPAQAQNPSYAHGDLVLYFQNPGGAVGDDKTVYVNLGNAATLFRQGASGTAGASNFLSIIDISQTMISAFGANWASELTLYAGLAGVWGTSPLGNTLQDGDPHRTVYVSKGRNGVGTLGQANSIAPVLNASSFMTDAAKGILDNQNHFFETLGTGAQAIIPVGQSGIDDMNPFNPDTGGQATAFNAFVGGVQQQGSGSSFGTFGPVGDAQFALDLYRILAKTGIAGQVEGPALQGSFEGTVVVDGAGVVSFVAVPEPSTGLLLAAAAGIAGFVRRRRTA